jgi:hypothetical protein
MRIESGDFIRLFGESEYHEVIRREGKNDLILSDHRMVSEYRVQYQKPLSSQIDEYLGL